MFNSFLINLRDGLVTEEQVRELREKFPKETGFSFQCRDLLLTTIQNEFIDDEVFTNEELQDNLSEEITECRKENDQIYTVF